MNSTKKNFWLDVILTSALIVVIVSSFVLDIRQPDFVYWGLTRAAWVIIHTLSALGMVGGLALHLYWHWRWIMTVLKRSDRLRPKPVRRNRIVDLILFVLLVILALTGLLIWPMSGNLYEGNPLGETLWLSVSYFDWKQLHAWGAVAIVALTLYHLSAHWGWIVTTARRYLAPNARRGVQ